MAPAEPENDAGASRSLTWRLHRIALVPAVGMQLLVRLSRERSSRPDRHTSRRMIIYGAGTDGRQLVRSTLSDPASGYLLDDRPDLRRRLVLTWLDYSR